MQVSDTNDVKIYNLSAGKSLPEWLSERKRRALLKKDVDVRRRIELIQDFDMPGVSNTIKLSKDGQYIMATGIYKPRMKCFEVNNLSLKFERCFDAEAITFEVLSDDYSKFVLMQNDRYIEFHVAHGRHYRMRIPKYGRDMKYHYPSCDLILVGQSNEIYRLNLERGQFMTPFTSTVSSAFNKVAVNPVHNLIVCGSQEGRVEAWDPRSKTMVSSLDCAFSCINENKEMDGFPSVTALSFNGALQMGVGTASGQILLYDIRSNKPYFVKDHMYGFPIKDVEFHYQQDLIYSMDKSILKIWDKNDGKLFTSIEASTEFNNLCVVPNSGLMFLANENTKMQTYYIPGLGPAPRWAAFLDSLTEELEENDSEIVYDDYKFVTKPELEGLGLEHLVGTNLLRGYMHGYFMDVRLYKKAKSVANPFEFDEYRKRKIRETIDKNRTNRVQLQKLPKVNKDLALKLMDEKNSNKKKSKSAAELLADDRFKDLFANPDFEVDKTADEYRLLNPVLTRLNTSKKEELKKKLLANDFEQVDEELEGKNSSDESSYDENEDSSDDDMAWTKQVKKQHKIINREHRAKEQAEEEEAEAAEQKQPQMFELRQGEEYKGIQSLKRKTNKISLGERIKEEEMSTVTLDTMGNRQMSFTVPKSKRDRAMDERNKRHREERKKLVRPTFSLKSKRKKF